LALKHVSERYASVGEAVELLLRTLRASPLSEVIESREALGRVLAEDVFAPYDIPPYDSSHMDGYAVRSEDIASATPEKPVRLRLKGKVGLGQKPQLHLEPGEAIALPTGGFLPIGADAVVPVEYAKVEDGQVLVTRPFARGSHVYPKGATIARGRPALRRGMSLRPQDIGLLIALRRTKVAVYRRPRAAILPVGSELTDDPDSEHDKVPNSHGPIIEGMLRLLGCEVRRFPIVADKLTELVDALRSALHEFDMVLTISGSSVGEADLVERALVELGPTDAMVHGLKLDPGRRGGFALVSGRPIFILPGLILGSMSVLLTLVLPLLRAAGCPGLPGVPARMSETWEARRRHDFTKVLYVELYGSNESFVAKPVLGETEKLTVLTQADGCIIVPEHLSRLERGDRVKVVLLPGFHLGNTFWRSDRAEEAHNPQTSIQ
jgi:molybdenum cofactor synthesis domain-containing protein